MSKIRNFFSDLMYLGRYSKADRWGDGGDDYLFNTAKFTSIVGAAFGALGSAKMAFDSAGVGGALLAAPFGGIGGAVVGGILGFLGILTLRLVIAFVFPAIPWVLLVAAFAFLVRITWGLGK